MGRLTSKQEAFCLAYVETGNASEAYRRAYDADRMKPATIHGCASELLRHPKIVAALRGLRSAHRARHAVTIDRLTGELEEARLLAIEKGHSAAAVSATMAKAKLHGLPVDAKSAAAIPLEALNDEELDAYVARLERDVAEATKDGGQTSERRGTSPRRPVPTAAATAPVGGRGGERR
jgi:hypothetical protein